MSKKVWYEIWLESDIDNYKECIIKVKSKGLAHNALNMCKEIYKNTCYKVVLKLIKC